MIETMNTAPPIAAMVPAILSKVRLLVPATLFASGVKYHNNLWELAVLIPRSVSDVGGRPSAIERSRLKRTRKSSATKATKNAPPPMFCHRCSALVWATASTGIILPVFHQGNLSALAAWGGFAGRSRPYSGIRCCHLSPEAGDLRSFRPSAVVPQGRPVPGICGFSSRRDAHGKMDRWRYSRRSLQFLRLRLSLTQRHSANSLERALSSRTGGTSATTSMQAMNRRPPTQPQGYEQRATRWNHVSLLLAEVGFCLPNGRRWWI